MVERQDVALERRGFNPRHSPERRENANMDLP
jgi:hypothetical protein